MGTTTKQHPAVKVHFWITLAVILAAVLALCLKATPFLHGLVITPFAVGPLIVTAVLARRWASTAAHVVLAASTLLFMCWFGFVYADIFYWHPDPQAAVGLFLTGLYALPVMLLCWVTAAILERGSRRRHSPDVKTE